MAHKLFSPARMRRSIPDVPANGVELKPPPAQEIEPRKSAFQRLMPVIMISAMGLMMVVMITMRSSGAGTGASIFGGLGAGALMPMMMMAPMLLSRLGQAGKKGEGPSEAEIDKERKSNALEIAKNRDKAHGIGEAIHMVTIRTFPNPEAMPTLIDSRHDTLWSVNEENNHAESGNRRDTGTDSGIPLKYPVLAARIGVGPRAMTPEITMGDMSDVTETREPVIFTQNLNFMAVNGTVQECAIGVNLVSPAYSMTRGTNEAGRYALARTMLLSLAYAHSPTDIHIIAVVGEEARDRWEWMKWLPHNENVFSDSDSVSRHGFTPLFYSDIRTATRDILRYRREFGASESQIFVVVDTPGESASLPRDVFSTPDDVAAQVFNADHTAMGIEDVTFLVVNGFDEGLTTPETRFKVDDAGRVHFYPLRNVPIRADNTTVATAERVARHLSAIRPQGFGQRSRVADGLPTLTPTAVEAPTLMDVVGTPDLATYDLLGMWEANDEEESFRAPIGFEVDDKNNAPTGGYAELDILQHASGGSGPHGIFSGSTGSGKSFLLKGVLLVWMLLFSPRRLVFILADFKGGATFDSFAEMPHVLACLSNLKDAVDMVDRTRAALAGEIERRQELLKKWQCEDYLAYHKLQRSHPENKMPDLPVLVFVADEFREFISKNPAYRDMFASLAAVGRSLGMNLLLGSQFLDQTLLGDSHEQFSYGFTLKVENASRSQVVIKSAEGAKLPANRVALLRSQHLQDSILTRFQGFNHELAYTPGSKLNHPGLASADTVVSQGDTTRDILSFNPETFIHEASLLETPPLDTRDIIDQEPQSDDAEVRDQFTAVRDMILEKGSNYTKPRSLWAEPMSTPMSLADIPTDYWSTVPDGQLRIGDIDVPFQHRRIPMILSLNGSNSTIAIQGDRGTGRSMVIKTLVAASAMRHTGNRIGWLLYDFAGTSLSDMEMWPNVGAYATRTDTDMWLRMRGEVDRIMELRETAWATQRPANLSDYIDRKAEFGITADPYGHLVVAIDGFGEWVDEIVRSGETSSLDWVTMLLSRGPQYGIHLVASLSATDGFKGVALAEKFGTRVILKHNDPTSLPVRGMDIRNLMATIPADAPGRVADGSMITAQGTVDWHHGRIMVPVPYKIEQGTLPSGGFGFDNHRDYSDAIRDLGVKLAELHERENPGTSLRKLTAPVGAVSFQKTWNLVQSHNPNVVSASDGKLLKTPQRLRKIPLGISISTGEPYFHNLDPQARARHLVVTGGAGKGATTVLRTHMSGVMATFAPDEAAMFILDGGGMLIEFQQRAVARGYMRPENYAMSRSKLEDIAEKLQFLIERRMPTEELLQENPSLRTTRGYFEGKEIFVYVDKYPSFKQPSPASPGLEKLMSLLESGIDVGIHFIVTETDAACCTDAGMSKFMAPLLGEQPTLLALLSSGYAGKPAYGAKFHHLPTGRVRMVTESGAETQIQIANVGPIQSTE